MNRTKSFHLVIVLLAAVALLWAQPCRADKNDLGFYLQSDLGIGYFAPPEITYVYETGDRSNDIHSGEHATLTAGLKAGWTLKGLDWAPTSLFGAAPVVEFSYRYDDYEERMKNFTRPNALTPAAGYGATGVWSTGTWDFKQSVSNNAFQVGLWGSDSVRWGFVPYLGMGIQRYRQHWQLDNFISGSFYDVFASKLDAYSYGVHIGGKWDRLLPNDWQFSITPMLMLNYVKADLHFQQSTNTALTGADDKMSTRFGTWSTSLDLGIKKDFGNGYDLGFTAGALYNNRTPYGSPPDTTLGRARILTGASYAVRAAIEFGVAF